MTIATDITVDGAVPQEWCDKHQGFVDEGRTQPYGTGSPYRICDGCAAEGRRLVARRESYHSCGYLDSFHIGGRCPQELGHAHAGGARAMGGDS